MHQHLRIDTKPRVLSSRRALGAITPVTVHAHYTGVHARYTGVHARTELTPGPLISMHMLAALHSRHATLGRSTSAGSAMPARELPKTPILSLITVQAASRGLHLHHCALVHAHSVHNLLAHGPSTKMRM